MFPTSQLTQDDRGGRGRGKKKGNGTLMVYVQIACDSKIPRREIDGYS